MQKVAFFDIDGTLFRSSLVIELLEGLIDEEVFPKSAREYYEREREQWNNREGTYEAYIQAVVRAYMENIKGVFYGDVADTGRLVVARLSKRVYRYTRDLIHNLKNDGYYLIAISQSPKGILDEFCKSYGFDKIYGRVYELGPTDCFTGAIIDEHLIQNKANIVHRVYSQQGFVAKDSVAVGDTESDIPMLELVETPMCFNPNKRLYDHAKRMEWKVVVERKDVIYEL